MRFSLRTLFVQSENLNGKRCHCFHSTYSPMGEIIKRGRMTVRTISHTEYSIPADTICTCESAYPVLFRLLLFALSYKKGFFYLKNINVRRRAKRIVTRLFQSFPVTSTLAREHFGRFLGPVNEKVCCSVFVRGILTRIKMLSM